MKVVRFQYGDVDCYGVVEDNIVYPVNGDIFGQYSVQEEGIAIDLVKLLAPCKPEKVVCVGLNYFNHIGELGMEVPDEPVIFLKPKTAIIGPNETIVRPAMSQRLDYEGELAVVIRKKAKDLSEAEARQVIFGYTCANDVTARDLQQKDGQWTRAKSFDTFLPIGPWIISDIDVENLKIETLLNDKVKQSSFTGKFIFSIPRLVSFISSVMTLYPGDIILTGTPEGVGPMEKGDKVSVAIENLGILTNFVK